MKKMTYAKLLSVAVFASVAMIIILSSSKAAAASFCGCGMLSQVNASNSDANCEDENDANCNAHYPGHTVANQYGSNNLESAGSSQATLKSNFIKNLQWFAGQHPYQRISASWIESRLGGSDWAARINSSSVTLKLQSHAYGQNTMYMPANNGGKPSTTNGSVQAYAENGSALSIVIYVNGVFYDAVKVDCGNMVGSWRPLPPPNKPPTGSFASLVCNAAAETYTIRVNFSDPDAATSAQLRNAANNKTFFTANGTSATWTISTKTLLPSDFPVGLWVKDTGPSGPNTYTRVATHAIANCNPQGSISALSCHTASIRLWDPNDPNGNVQYYLTINGTKSGPTTLNGGQGAGAVTVDVLNRAGFDPWKPNSVTLLGVDGQTGSQVSVGSVTLSTICDSISCGGTSMPSDLVAGEQYQFQVWVHVNGPKVVGPSGAKFNTVKIEALNTNSGYSLSGSDLYSSKIPFTPQTAGTYTLTWVFSGGEANPPTTTCTQNNIRVAYEQYFTVLGGDASAGQGFGPGCVANTAADIAGETLDTGGKYFGASSRQAAIASGQINQFATDTTNFIPSNMGGSSDGVNSHQPSGLAFANSAPSGTTYGGGYVTSAGQSWCVPDYAGSVSGTVTGTFIPSAGSLSTLGVNSGDHIYEVNGDQNINGNITLQKGVHVTIVVTGGDVYMNSNVNYAGYTQLQDIPQFTLIVHPNALGNGGNLYIAHNVSTLHGTYIAQPTNASNGMLFTCATGLGSPSTNYGQCNNALTFYGAVSAGELVPGRTEGNLSKTSAVSDLPAEQFVYGPELWLGSVVGGGVSCAVDPAQAQCLYQSYTSLPPVF